MAATLRVVATAGHVDHGKSSLIQRLTDIDPDRWAEEKRRGLTIDLGYAWCELPSGREIGFVDVPGHERFIHNMLAGVGPVRVVLFVVAADEGWKPQSEEHLQILDVLGIAGGVIALTKRDLVEEETLAIAEQEIRERLAGTGLADAAIVPVSSVTGEGIDELRSALDAMLIAAPAPLDARTRLFVDRVFTIKGAGTVVTGTLGGGSVAVGDEVELLPTGDRARIRSLQMHERPEAAAQPVSRVALNLVGAERDDLARGDVVASPGEWRPTDVFEAVLRPVRDLAHAVTVRGAYTIHAGAAETGARLRLYGTARIEPGSEAFVRVRTVRPLVLDVGDRFVLREAGRGETVAGGTVLDVAPPPRPGRAPEVRLAARANAERADLKDLLVAERGAISAAEVELLTGAPAGEGWLIAGELRGAATERLLEELRTFHAAHPLDEGAPLEHARLVVADALRRSGSGHDPAAAEALLSDIEASGAIARTATSVRLATHRVTLDERSPDIDRLLEAIGGERESTPPTVAELAGSGFGRDLIDAAARAGLIVRLSSDLVMTTAIVGRAETTIRGAGGAGITVSALREALGTSRKYAVPLLEWFDRQGVTRREGDLRFVR